MPVARGRGTCVTRPPASAAAPAQQYVRSATRRALVQAVRAAAHGPVPALLPHPTHARRPPLGDGVVERAVAADVSRGAGHPVRNESPRFAPRSD